MGNIICVSREEEYIPRLCVTDKIDGDAFLSLL